ncbi:TrkH family potassium uptake protein [Candidatus Hecatella orcuttiae]|uniref:TrkH family potassium uptake protein n=1 Tax=Candidatus Hecatella orcuttiae TaxID=1935119 RepID=UPI002868026D|nr:TrkH family potassium uptake protein [Candidatus Hecatella orcuttiae]
MSRNIPSYLAYIILAIGLTLFIPALLGLFYGEFRESMVFTTIAGLSCTASLLTLWRTTPGEISYLEAMVIAALGWLLVSFLGAIPFILIAQMTPLDAYFEAMSGFTTTGMTLLDVEHIPFSLLFWRALTQWIGGVGIVLLFILFASPAGIGIWRLYRAEAREERLAAKARDTVKMIWVTYVGYTAACALLLWIVGFSPFDALTHSFTTLSTGGFSTRNLSIGAFGNPFAEVIIMIFMFLGGTSFLTHMRVFTKTPKAFFRSIEVQICLLIIAVSTFLVTADLLTHQVYQGIETLRAAAFQVTSILTTTGYTTVDINSFPNLSKSIFTVLMTIGGGVGSTGGAMKILRIVILFKLVAYTITKAILPPGTVRPMKLGGHALREEEILRVAGFFAAYIFLLTVQSLILAFSGYDIVGSVSAAFSAQGNIGPSFLSISSNMPVLPKLTLIFGMWAGRLEILPILILLSPATWREFSRLGER